MGRTGIPGCQCDFGTGRRREPLTYGLIFSQPGVKYATVASKKLVFLGFYKTNYVDDNPGLFGWVLWRAQPWTSGITSV